MIIHNNNLERKEESTEIMQADASQHSISNTKSEKENQ